MNLEEPSRPRLRPSMSSRILKVKNCHHGERTTALHVLITEVD